MINIAIDKIGLIGKYYFYICRASACAGDNFQLVAYTRLAQQVFKDQLTEKDNQTTIYLSHYWPHWYCFFDRA